MNNQKKILVIDDEKSIRETLSELLSFCDYKVILAKNGVEGVEFAEKQSPDLIICDIMMPELDGYEVAKRVRSNDKMAMIPFIYICYELFAGLKDAVDKQPTNARGLVSMARYVTIGSWLTYPFVYVIPMFGASGASALVGVQIGYSISDVISKCGVGLMITKIAMLKSRGSADSLIQGGGGGGSESYLPA